MMEYGIVRSGPLQFAPDEANVIVPGIVVDCYQSRSAYTLPESNIQDRMPTVELFS